MAKKRRRTRRLVSKNTARTVIIIVGIITAFCGAALRDIRIEYNFEDFFPNNDTDKQFYFDYIENFSTDNDFLMIALENKGNIFDSLYLTKVRFLTDTISKLEHVESVMSITTEKTPVAGPMGVINVPFVHIDQPANYAKDSIRIYTDPNMVGSLVSTDGRSTCLYVNTSKKLERKKEAGEKLLLDIESLIDSQDFNDSHIAGKLKSTYYFVRKMKYELVLFMSISFFLLIFFLWLSFRSLRLIWTPIAVVLCSVVWIFAIRTSLDKPVNLMTTLIPTILFVVGISSVVHIMEKYVEELRLGKRKLKALRLTFREIGLATFLTALTTAIGFLTLLTSSIHPVREFGIFTALGVFISFILAFSLLPSVLALTAKPGIAVRDDSRFFWKKRLHRILKWMIPNRRIILLTACALVLVSAYGIYKIKINSTFIQDYAESDDIRNDFLYFEKYYSGFRIFELAVWVKDEDKTIMDYDVLKEMDKVDHYLRRHYGCGFLISPLNYVKTAYRATKGGNAAYFKIPDNETEFKKLSSTLKRLSKGSSMRRYLSKDRKLARFSGKMADIGGYYVAPKNEKLDFFMHNRVNDKLIAYRLTGMPTLVDKNNRFMAINMVRGLAIAFLVIAIVMGLLYKRLLMVVIALLPNALPLLLVAGVMGYLGIDLKMSTSVIFTIAFGISVDDTIHFLSRFRQELEKEKSVLYALKRTYISTGKAIVVTSLVLCSGFLVLIAGDITSTFYIGLLISLTLFFALISNLLVLPSLILIWYKNKGVTIPAEVIDAEEEEDILDADTEDDEDALLP